MRLIEKKNFDAERALYAEKNILLKECSFDGPLDGESALKEGGEVRLENCFFNLRYPLWHCDGVELFDSEMTESCRAALWYSTDIEIKGSELKGIKALRECKRARICSCQVVSPEFGWFSSDVTVRDSSFVSEYFMLRAERLDFDRVDFKGKYSFQYIKDSSFDNCVLDTKDAFWHAENITVRNSTVKGEYLGWYSENITFENCHIIGTQPLCYCKGLRLINCRMTDCDLAFEKSEVIAEVSGEIDSVKNALSGRIAADRIGEIIAEEGECEIIEKRRENATNH